MDGCNPLICALDDDEEGGSEAIWDYEGNLGATRPGKRLHNYGKIHHF